MSSIFGTPIFITLIIVFYALFFFVLFLIKLPEKNVKQQKTSKTSKASEEITQVAKESQPEGKQLEGDKPECTMFGFLQKLPKGESIPDECMSCQKLVECLMKKNAFDWYSGQNSSKKSEP